MLSIEYQQLVEDVDIASLFDELDLVGLEHEEICCPCEYGVEIRSFDDFYHVEAFRTTALERTCTLNLADGRSLRASPHHLVARKEAERVGVWRHIEDLDVGDQISTVGNELATVASVEYAEHSEVLYDLQVAIAHSYIANDVLSHNSHFLVNVSASALRQGLNVLFYTFELSESKIGIRFDSNFTGIDSNEITERKDDVAAFYAGGSIGKLKIKYFPTNTATVNTLRSHMEKLSLRGFVPDVLVVDYADIMRSSRQYDSPRHELKLLYEELRAFAAERNVAVWTASQSNREGFNADVVDMNNMSESFSKAFIADFIITLSRKSSERSSGHGRIYVAKNRNGKDGLVYPVSVDTARSRFAVVGEETSPELAKELDERDVRKALRDKFKQFEENGPLPLKRVG